MRVYIRSGVLILCVLLMGVLSVQAGLFGKKKGATIVGFLWATNTTPAVGKTVQLLDAETGKQIAEDQSGFTGKFKFKGLPPGSYIVRAGQFAKRVELEDKTVRVHFNFSSPDGEVDFYATAQENAKKVDEMTGAAAADAGPTDPALAQWIAGEYYSYEGSTERKLMLCPGGIFYDSRESSYSGTNYDSLGNETSGYGAASASAGNGKWAIQGTRQSGTITFSYKGKGVQKVEYRALGDNCFSIMGIKFCYAGAARCN